jgi:type IV secretion system protein VirD4
VSKTQGNENRLLIVLLWILLFIPVLWLAAVFAQTLTPSITLDELMNGLTAHIGAPFSIRWTEKTGAFLIAAAVLYALGISCYYGTKGNRRPGEEHGSAKWGKATQLNIKYRDAKYPENNVILTQNIKLGMDTHKHRRNLNVLVVGGSGSGKTRFYAKPNLMQANCSFIVADPKGEILRDVGPLLEQKGLDITVFDLINMELSDGYNPLTYLRDDKDALKLVSNLIKNTTPKTSKSDDPFWEKAESALLTALILYLIHEAPENEQNFSTIMIMIENAGAREDDESYQSPLDMLFDALEEIEPEHIALKQYKIFKQAAGKTAKSILISAAVRLAAFNLPEISRITSHDDMDLGSLGERKRAVFCVIPDNDASFNYLVGMLYTQAFQELYYKADHECDGRLPIPVRLIMDEFANIALPDDFERILATMRSREISVSIIIQNMAQLKALFKESWENITGNCDTLLYLGGNEQSTHEYISKMLGKATIDTRTHGRTKGHNGSSSTNFQNTGRELLTIDEVRQMDNENALLFIRGERPVMDKKYDLLKHPNIKQTQDGGNAPYQHGQAAVSYALDDIPYSIEDPDEIEIIKF